MLILHIVSRALYTGLVASKCPIEKLHKFLHNSPSWRAEYLCVSCEAIWPEKFCMTCSVENGTVVNWANKSEIKYLKANAKAKSKSYDHLKACHKNLLGFSVSSSFRDVATRLNGFVLKFQTDSPMVRFLSEEMSGVFKIVDELFHSERCFRKG